jgi:3-hydroxyisobutyrate dehydrogenase-like beta-hydroxyacid dehydrogenase
VDYQVNKEVTERNALSVITILGLGEAGRLYARGLIEAGASIRGYDPFVDARSAGIAQFDELSEAVAGSDVVISLVGSGACRRVADNVLPLLQASAMFADFNTASPRTKAELAALASSHRASMVDVAVMAPVPREGSKTPLMVSGDRAADFAAVLGSFGTPVDVVPGPAGAAAGRKLLRSVFMKGLAGIVLECEAAGQAAGCSEWLLSDIAQELGPNGGEFVNRLITGSHQHAERRTHEVRDALSFLQELGSPSWMTEGTLEWISSLRSSVPT